MLRHVPGLGLAAALACLASTATAETIHADVWADNWFAFYLDATPVAEDSVPITTERSFNAESFSFEAERPFALNFIVKDFKQNDTGLEYIGTNRQQMGDAGFIAQFFDGSGALVATDSDWRCLVVQDAPADANCAGEANPVAGLGACAFSESPEPAGWQTLAFDDSAWPPATEYSAREVSPKDGYDRIRWDNAASLIWGPDLKTNNTLLCRRVVE
jgi:hypothetical protein